MQIITKDNLDFPLLLLAWRDGKCIGRYWEEGIPHTVCASNRYLMISSGNGTEKFAFKPTRSLQEAEALASQVLRREEKRGNQVERSRVQ